MPPCPAVNARVMAFSLLNSASLTVNQFLTTLEVKAQMYELKFVCCRQIPISFNRGTSQPCRRRGDSTVVHSDST